MVCSPDSLHARVVVYRQDCGKILVAKRSVLSKGLSTKAQQKAENADSADNAEVKRAIYWSFAKPVKK